MRVLKTIGFDRVWARAEGQYLYDGDGKRYLDMLGGFGMFNVGRNNPRVRDALVEVLELDDARLGAARRLAAARAARRGAVEADAASDRPRALHELRHGGCRGGAQARPRCDRTHARRLVRARLPRADARRAVRERRSRFVDRFGPLLPGFSQVPFGDLDALERELRSEDVALFLVEPVQGKGVNLPPDGYLAGAQELCRRYGTLFAVDEVQTGFGRTGRLFAFEHWGLEPDLVTVAKSLSGGYVPVGRAADGRSVFTTASSTRSSTRSATARPSRRTISRWPPASRRCASSTRRSSSPASRTPRRAAARADADARRAHDVVQDVRGPRADVGDGVRRARPGQHAWRVMERMQPGLFAQLVVVPLFTQHRILSQVAGHDLPVVKGLPPLVISEQDVDWFAAALDETIGEAQKLPLDDPSFALRAARAGRKEPAPNPLAAPTGSAAPERRGAGKAPRGDDGDRRPVLRDRLVAEHDVADQLG